MAYGIDTPTSVVTMPALSPAGNSGYFTVGNTATGVLYTQFSQDWFNIIQAEQLNLVTGAGI